jgi:hypothetical protein
LEKIFSPETSSVAPSKSSLKPLTFTRVYEAPSISKGGGALLKAGDLAKAIEDGKYEMES